MTSDWTISHQITLVLCGMFFWDYSITLWFEWRLVRGEMKLGWPLIPYFLARYTTLGFVLVCLFFQTLRTPANCDAMYISGNLLGKLAVASASVNLAVRAILIWSYQRYILLLLGALVTGQIVLTGIGLLDRTSSATWSEDLQYCIGSSVSHKTDLGLFAPYALSFDCVIVILTIVGLRNLHPKKGLRGALIRQGLSFFIVVLFFQTFVAVAVFTNGNEVLVYVSTLLCAVIVPMVSCHLVRSVLDGSYSAPGSRVVSHGSSTVAGGCSRGGGVQLTSALQLDGSASSC